METKSQKIREALAAGEPRKALSIAAKFFDRSPETQLYQRAQAAANNAGFYRQIGRDPDAIVAEALESLNRRFA